MGLLVSDGIQDSCALLYRGIQWECCERKHQLYRVSFKRPTILNCFFWNHLQMFYGHGWRVFLWVAIHVHVRSVQLHVIAWLQFKSNHNNNSNNSVLHVSTSGNYRDFQAAWDRDYRYDRTAITPLPHLSLAQSLSLSFLFSFPSALWLTPSPHCLPPVHRFNTFFFWPAFYHSSLSVSFSPSFHLFLFCVF